MRSRRRIWLALAIVLYCVLGVGAIAVGWAALRVRPVQADLAAAASLVRTLQRQLDEGDLPAARTTLATLRSQAADARSATGSADWSMATHAPVVGDDLAAVRTIATVLDDLSQQALPTLVDLAGSVDLSTLVPTHGGLELGPLRELAPRLAVVAGVVDRSSAEVAAVDPSRLAGPVRAAVSGLRDGLDRLDALIHTAVRAATLLPPMLGLDGPRTYLVLLQNLAEVRATGGMPGAFIVIRADHGALALVGQGSAASALRTFAAPVLPLTASQRLLYTDRLGLFPADVNLTPDFPTAAVLAREMYRRRSGTTVDGVLATDPVALSYLLHATGAVTVPGGPRLTAATAVRVLLSDAYATMSGPEQDRYFAAAARATFARLTDGSVDPRAALARAAGERRLLVWSSHPAEQAAISGTVLAGQLPADDGPRPLVGVFLNDGTGAKLDYYLTHSAQVSFAGCRPDGRRMLRVKVTLGSTAPPRGLPPDVLGLALGGRPYVMRTNLMLFSPAGGQLQDLTLDGRSVPFGQGLERNRLVGVLTVDLQPGQTRIVVANVLTEAYSSDELRGISATVAVTPGVNSWSLSGDVVLNCPVVG